jgi:hypothetical protein
MAVTYLLLGCSLVMSVALLWNLLVGRRQAGRGLVNLGPEPIQAGGSVGGVEGCWLRAAAGAAGDAVGVVVVDDAPDRRLQGRTEHHRQILLVLADAQRSTRHTVMPARSRRFIDSPGWSGWK